MLFPVFLRIALYILIPKVIAQIFNSTAKFIMPTETETNESKPEIETQKLTAEMKIRKYSKELKVLHPFFFFFFIFAHQIIVSFLLKDNLLFHLFS